MLMKQLPIVAAAALMLTACSDKPGYQIAGNVKNTELDGKYVYLYSMKEGFPVMDSALVSNGSFTFKGTQDSLTLCALAFKNDVVEPARVDEGEDGLYTTIFALDNSNLQVTLDTLSDVTGSPANDAVQGFKEKLRSLRNEQQSFIPDMRSDDAQVSREAGSKYDAIDEEIAVEVENFIKANIDNPKASTIFYDFRYYLSEDSQRDILSLAGEQFKSKAGISQINDRLEKLKSVAVGQKFADLELKDVKGKSVKLSDYVGKGKVVLIDFWASWCPPCRRETPKLVELYKQYKDKGFEIVGVSFDSKQEAWEKGIKDLGITWPQMSDLQGWKSIATTVYYVNSIPHTVLVDKDGTIIARNIHGEKIAKTLAEIFD